MATLETRQQTLADRGRALGGVVHPVALLLVAAAVFLVVGALRSEIFAQQTVAGLAQAPSTAASRSPSSSSTAPPR